MIDAIIIMRCLPPHAADYDYFEIRYYAYSNNDAAPRFTP